MTDLTLRRCSEADDQELLQLHNRSFVPQWGAGWWKWRYREVPCGEAAILGAFRGDGRCVGMYAGVRLALMFRGKVCSVLSQSDVSVDSEYRGGSGSAKLVTRMASEFFRLFCSGQVKLTYGFPVPPLRRVISQYLGGSVLCDVVFLIHDLHPTPQRATTIRVRRVETFGADADELWAREKDRHGVALVRDSSYLNWRYALHPVDYELLEARDSSTGALRGLSVLREGGLDPKSTSLMEWLVPDEDSDSESALIDFALGVARERGSNALVAWFQSSGDHFHRFQTQHGFYARATVHQEQFTLWHEGLYRDWLQENWYQTMGDIDFF